MGPLQLLTASRIFVPRDLLCGPRYGDSKPMTHTFLHRFFKLPSLLAAIAIDRFLGTH